MCWYSIWHSIWHSVWHFMWVLFWHSICILHSAGILFDIQSNILPGILSGILSDILAGMCSGPCVPSCTLSLRQGSAHIQTYPAGGFQGFRGAVESTARVDPQEVSDRSKVAFSAASTMFPDPRDDGIQTYPNHQWDWNRKTWIFSQKYGCPSRFHLKPIRNVEQPFKFLSNSGICQASACGCLLVQSDYLHL